MSPFLNLPRNAKRCVAAFADSTIVAIAVLLVYAQSPSQFSGTSMVDATSLVALTAMAGVLINYRLGLYRAILRYLNVQLVSIATFSALLTALVFTGVMLASQSSIKPFSVLLFGLLVFAGQVSARFWFLAWVGSVSQRSGQKVLVYGAGSTGRQLIKGLNEDHNFHCVGFIDDASLMWGLMVEGIKVYRPSDIEALVERYGVEKVLLAIPSASFNERRKVLKKLERLPVQVQTVPSLRDIVSGNALVDQLNDVTIDDILGRDAVQPNADLLARDITGKTVVVTGAGGSIGSEICRQVMRQKPRSLVLFDISEFALYSIHQELEAFVEANEIELHTILGSVQNYDRVSQIFQRFSPDTVYHAAAYKHVPLVEHNMFEGVRNNVTGTFNAVKAAYETKVSKFVLISTDKAVRPTNVMGASKRFAELVVQAYAELSDDTVFCMVRFGNVLGSSGSVVPKFKAQIQQGGPVTLTHKDITRYFMTIPEASQLVIQAGALAHGGEVFVLDMGEPVKIYDLACRLINFSGLEVSKDGPGTGDIDIVVSGLRKGEKLYEELLIGDNATGTSHPKIMTARESCLDMAQLNSCMQQFEARLHDCDFEGLRSLLCGMPLAYSPTDEICDELFVQDGSKASGGLFAADSATVINLKP